MSMHGSCLSDLGYVVGVLPFLILQAPLLVVLLRFFLTKWRMIRVLEELF